MEFSVNFSDLDIYGKIIFGLIFLSSLYICSLMIKNVLRWFDDLVSKTKKGFIKIGPLSFGKGQTSETDTTSTEVQNTNVIHVKDVIHILQFHQKILNEIFYIKDKGILKEQMAFAESKIDLIITQAESMMKCILENNVKDYLFSKEYVSFKLVLELIKEKSIIKIRLMCKENHFSEKSEEDFREYAKTHTAIILSMIQETITSFYPFKEILETHDKMKPLYDNIFEAISEIIFKSREIAKEKLAEIQKLENEFEERYTRIIGEK